MMAGKSAEGLLTASPSSDQQDSCWSKRRKMSRRQFSAVRSTAHPVYSPRAGAGRQHDLARKSASQSAAAERGIFNSTSHADTGMSRTCHPHDLVFSAAHSQEPHRTSAKQVPQLHTAVLTVPNAALPLVRATRRPPPHSVRLSLRSPNSNISDLEDDDSDSAGAVSGGSEMLDADRLELVVFPAEPLLGRFSDCFAIFAMRLRSMFSSGGNRRHRASPTVGSTSCRHRAQPMQVI